MQTNADRAEDAFREVIRLRNWGDNDPETDLGDFLCNLHHLCDEQGWEWETILYKADYHYSAEVSEDES